MSRPSVHPTRGALRALARRDPRLGQAMKDCEPYPGFPYSPEQRGGTHFENLARAIVYQQLSGAAAGTIYRRYRALVPGPRPPRPWQLLELGDAQLRGAGLSRAKVAALRDLAERIETGQLVLGNLGRLDDGQIIERLITVRGIGEWSAQMFLIFRLGRLDVLAGGDLGLQEGLRRLDGSQDRPTPQELLERGELWRPLRSVASWVLWQLADQK